MSTKVIDISAGGVLSTAKHSIIYYTNILLT